jgi:hypothetical protein
VRVVQFRHLHLFVPEATKLAGVVPLAPTFNESEQLVQLERRQVVVILRSEQTVTFVQLTTKLSPCPILTQGLVVELQVVFGVVALSSEVILVPFPGAIVTLELLVPFGGIITVVAFVALVPLLVPLVVETFV